jgi:hypothetical protein
VLRKATVVSLVLRGIADLLAIVEFGERVASVDAEIGTDIVTSNAVATVITTATFGQYRCVIVTRMLSV